MTEDRILYLDVVRILACLMVITMHAPMPDVGTPGYVLAGVSFITAPCIGLFFMVSGALLLPVRLSMKDFYKKRLSKVVWPTLIWTGFYIIVSMIEGKVTFSDLPKIICSIPFSAQGHGILWFMYTLIGLYLLAPIISPWIEKASKRELELVLAFWGITLFYGLLSRWLTVNQSASGILYSFTGYAGYFLLGYYLNRFKPRIHWTVLSIMLIVPIAIVGFVEIKNLDKDFYSTFWYLSIFVAAMAASWFIIVQSFMKGCSLPVKVSSRLEMVSNLSFGIYLVHIFIMREVLWKMKWISSINGIAQIVLTVIITFLLSWGVSWVLSQLPIGRIIVGYQHKKK